MHSQESSGTVSTGPPSTGASHVMPPPGAIPRAAHAKEYSFLDIELKYGILQVSAHFFPTPIAVFWIHFLCATPEWTAIRLIVAKTWMKLCFCFCYQLIDNGSIVISTLFRSCHSSKCLSIVHFDNKEGNMEVGRSWVCWWVLFHPL